MAAYAALISLKNNLEQILQKNPYFFDNFHKSWKDSFCGKVDFLLDFLECYNSYGGISNERADELEMQIASAAHLAEDVFESHIVDYRTGRFGQLSASHITRLFPSIYMDSIMEKVLKIKELNDQKPTNSTPAALTTPITVGRSSMVGFDDEFHQLMDVIVGQESHLQFVSIVGMGGTGKTTLARNVYESSHIMHHFDFCAWATISQEYSVREIFLQLLSFQRKFTNESVDELGERLHKILFGRRYLIILDDVWGVEVWAYLKFFFPDNDEGSRVILTTRLSHVATHLCSFSIRISFLDENSSWNLFCQEVFGQEICPPELVGIGKRIVEQCKGLPLSIVVTGGLLRKSCKTEEYWQSVARNINSVHSRDKEQCLDVLYMSYCHLPAHLKPCFLYLGIYREDQEICVSEIINLWVAEGFLKPNGVYMLEDIAKSYLSDLLDRNLILICARRSNGKCRSFRIHDLLRELCLRVADKKELFFVVREKIISRGIDRERRLIFYPETSCNHKNEVLEDLGLISLVRTLIGDKTGVPVKCRLLRVLNVALDRLEAKIQNVNLRYVAYLSPAWSVLPSAISQIWNLQTLIIKSAEDSDQVIVAPLEIWRMLSLRHLKCSRVLLPDPPPSDKDDYSVVLRNLQTLTTTVNFRLSEEACKRIPYIQKLGIAYGNMWDGYDDCLHDNLQNLCSLHRLKSLHILCFNTISINELKNVFPGSLKKLSLTECSVHWGDLSLIIGSLPVLQVLKLKKPLCEVCNWSCVEGGFLRLKFLQIESCALKSWTSNSASCFPVLEKLVLVDLWDLNEIPSSIGEISTLQLIRLEDCTESATISAMKINMEQEYFGNDGLQIQVIMSPGNSVGFKAEGER